jgi:hypothetical protein
LLKRLAPRESTTLEIGQFEEILEEIAPDISKTPR